MLVVRKIEKDYPLGKVKKGTKITQRLIHTHIINGMKELRNKTKEPGLKKAFQKIIDIREKELKKMKEGRLKEAPRIGTFAKSGKDESIFDVAARVLKNKSMENYKSKRGMVKLDMQTANLLVKV